MAEQTAVSAALQETLMRAQSASKASHSGSEPEPEPKADARAEAIAGAWERSGVPKRYRDVPAAKQPVGWAYITGQVGSGKTYGACAMIRRYIDDNTFRPCGDWDFYTAPRVRFTTVVGYLKAVKAHFADASDDTATSLANADLLVLDDLGQEMPTQWAVEQLFELINDRYNEERPTIVTSQFGLDVIASRLSERGGREQAEAIASRLMGCCTAYRLTCGDRRVGGRDGE